MKNNYKETHQTWNKIAQLYQDKFMDLAIYNDSYQQFCNQLPSPNANILELGCGPGNITRAILKHSPKLQILATDVSANMIKLAKKNNPTITTKVLDCRHITTLKNTYDGIICGFTIPYLSDLDCTRLIKDISQLLNSGGVLYLSFVAGDYARSGYLSGSSGDRTYFYYHPLEGIQQDLESANMKITKLTKVDYPKSDGTSEVHTIVHARKTV